MFSAAASRVCLGPGESLDPLMAQAASQAIASAGLSPSEIDRLYGAAVLGSHIEPSPLYGLHRQLGLRRDALVVPQGTNFSGFLSGLILAAEAVRAGAARYVLVAVGARMSPHVEPGSGYAVSIADGAGAVVVGPGQQNVILDFATDTDGSLEDGTTLDVRSGAVTFEISAEHIAGVHRYGVEEPPKLVSRLLERHGLRASDVTLVAHQASRVLIDHWQRSIRPGQYLDTFDRHGNATVASIPMTLATALSPIDRPYLVLLSPGMGMHATAVLVRR
ncbi:MAG: 3-oxoacyl-[acyl-carrier-protein] synthase III C-terminal domain-containing protein [Polyangiaceae bacterium]